MLKLYKYKPHYFQIEDIFATQERVPCKFPRKVMFMGHLDSSSEGEDLEQGTCLELPFWVVKALSDRDLAVVDIELPKVYKETFRDILKADASVVDLYKLSKFFYRFGQLLSQIEVWQNQELQTVLVQTFKDRFRQLMDWVQNIGADQIVTNRLDVLERQLLANGREAQSCVDKWLAVGAGKMVAADMVVNHKKRKLCTTDFL